MIWPSTELERLLYEFMELPSENEWLEFKEAKDSYDYDDIGKYFSALSNEANLHGKDAGWLIFGVTNKRPRRICGTGFRSTPPGLDRLKESISHDTNHKITFIQIHELKTKEGRVLLFEIPPAPIGIPTEWKGKMYGRIHESIDILSLDEIDRIRGQLNREDWSVHICSEATLDDLDADALAFAREQFKKKNKGTHIETEVDESNNITFLNKSKVCINGKITRAAIILLGKSESEHFLSPGIAKITWVLRDHTGTEIDYQHFSPPFLLAMEQIFSKIRNLTYRHIPNMSLFPTEVSQYDPWVIRETLHNCVAHQDYSMTGRITVLEEPEYLLFTNLGKFLPGSVQEVINRDSPPEFYRNRFLAEAMVNFNMIDTIGSGIKRIFSKQWKRNFPMPDYDLTEQDRVKVRIYGKVIDEKYTQMLIA
ncbi:MAG TPA: RNA-binding domain-containing protein [Methanospirillum sp.]|uniref:RNA-binding domain-containing protein n=1 Tax=Methanospirillum sp. TaxID=45200 RepID=UPI002CC2A08A|nr:RNA-binding domain-containing protein [Methanospirillum sp.]HWQ63072.1 RNA-binding domain-containing protein [Methanospirillum sp.]